MAIIGSAVQKKLQSAAKYLEDHANIRILPSPVHVVLKNESGWRIELTKDAVPTRDMIGYTGLIENTNEGEYKANELTSVLRCLNFFFAFVKGAYCHPTSVIGYDSQSWPVWGQIGRFQSDSYHHLNWFNNTSSVAADSTLEELFPRFWRKWLQHKEEMIAIIECYVHSNALRNAGFPKDAVAKSYAGIEILASLASNETIRGDSSKEIHRVLLNYRIPHLQLNNRNSPTMTRLCEDLGESKLRGAFLLGDVRNYVVHPLNPSTSAEIKEKQLNTWIQTTQITSSCMT